MSAVTHSDILIIGGGTVGLAAAAALVATGFSVQLVERGNGGPALAEVAAATEVDARVYALSPASIQFLTRLGAWAAIGGLRAAPYKGMRVWQAEPARALHFSAASADASMGCIVEHSLLNAALWALPELGLRHTSASVESVQVEDGAVQARLADGRSLSAKLLVVADGPASVLPAQLGLEAQGRDYGHTAIVCHARCEQNHGGIARQRFFVDDGPLALLPLADGRVSVVWSCQQRHAEELLALDDAAFALRLTTASQQVLGGVLGVTPRRSFALQLKRLASTVAEGAVVIGDAAHVVHPLAGQGVNLGLADAAALAAVLGEARAAGRGWWRQRTLKAYARARQPDTDEVLALTDGLHRAFANGGEAFGRLLGLGFQTLNQIAPVKHWLAGRAQR